jgi:uncharacterized protein
MPKTVSGIQIRKTPVGKGLFATKSYRKNQTIGQMTGVVITDDDYDPDYVVDLGKAGVLEPRAPFRFLNHCCEPNACLIEYEADPGDVPTMWVEALRAIRPGDQVTIDYAWPADAAIPCLCGAKSCRGWVVGAGEVGKVKRRLAKADKASKAAKGSKAVTSKTARSRTSSRPATPSTPRKRTTTG